MFDRQLYQDEIWNHQLYLQTLHEKDPDIIANNITKILQDRFDSQAPVSIIQISKKKSEQLSTEAQDLLAQRDQAYSDFKHSGSLEHHRDFRHLRNLANRPISCERFDKV